MVSLRNTLLMSSAATVLALGGMPAHGQSGAPTVRLDEAAKEIVVTAQKREQTLIDVPQSISVVSEETIEKQNITNIGDYLGNVPSLQLVQSTPGQGRLVLRGVNTGGVASTVAVYMDETPFGSSSGLANGAELAGDFDTFDIARIEVLRGPQGTLYGASSLGGLVKYVTNEPDAGVFEARGRISGELTRHGDPSYQGNLMVNVPLSPTLAFRASGSYRMQGGFIDSIGTGGSDVESNINDYRSYGGRASLQWMPTDALTVRATALIQNIDVDGPTTIEADGATLKPLYGGLTYSQFVPSYSDVDYRVYNLQADYDLGFATLTSSTSRSTQHQRRRDDQTVYINNVIGVYAPAFGLPDYGNETYLRQLTNNRKWTQEVRLASAPNDKIEWLIGGYYTHEKALIDQVFVPVAPGTLTPQTYIEDLGGLGGAATISKYEEYAGFGNMTLHFGEHLDLDLGGRYSHNNQTSLNTGFGLLGATTPYAGTSSDNVFTYSVAPKYRFSEHASLYARVAKGYRPGGPNVVPPGAGEGFPATFDPDTVTSYEIGVKAETLDRSFGIEAAIYHIDWSDIQLLAVVNNFGVNINGTSADIDGAELTVTLRPVRGFTTTVNGAYTRAMLAGDTDPITLGAVKGDVLPYTPKFSIGVNSDYEWSIGEAVTASIGGSIRSLSKQSGNYDATYLALYGHFPRVPAYAVVDLRAGIDFGRFSLQAYVKNLGDVRGVTSVLSQYSSGLPYYPNAAIGTGINRPRTFGLSLTAGI
ncbi:TonB-dependent receptor [Novosphingobium profundi]|uniref:TonB-dependent receptor n=1 Tax=Novosphingobium profundi TaxID=1774954 RepID=UPI001CFDDE1D|nr:TonB-dependent receptor [Novosphingobium profundi]